MTAEYDGILGSVHLGHFIGNFEVHSVCKFLEKKWPFCEQDPFQYKLDNISSIRLNITQNALIDKVQSTKELI